MEEPLGLLQAPVQPQEDLAFDVDGRTELTAVAAVNAFDTLLQE